jgi:phosphomannomutase
MTPIKFGTDGWRAIIGKDYTADNVARVSEATALWLLNKNKQPSVVIGYDTRFGGEMFAETAARVFCMHNVKVFMSKTFASTPMVSLATVNLKASLGVVITASHNPPSYNGYKLKASYGGPLQPEYIEEIEKLLPAKAKPGYDNVDLKACKDKHLLQYVDLEEMYCQHVQDNFDLDLIRRSGIRLGYDAMFGAGQNVISRLLPDTALLHCEYNPSFRGQAPEPIQRNLREFAELIKSSKSIDCGLATDGDADRIGLFDHEGNFIDANHIMLLLVKYMVEEKKIRGKVVTSFSVTPKVKKMCDHFGLAHQVTRIGFKYIAPVMAEEDVLLGGEESGGIALKGHIPERDGIWIGLTILEYMARSGKSLQHLIKDVYSLVGPFSFERSDLHLQEDVKNQIVENCKKNYYTSFGSYKIQRTEDTDGYKFFFTDDEWLMIRASGTEPVLRNYAESSSAKRTALILKAAEETLLKQSSPVTHAENGSQPSR